MAQRYIDTTCPMCLGLGHITKKNKGPKAKPLEENFWSKVNKLNSDECWEWLGYINPKSGYGQFSSWKGNATIGAHRASYILHNMEDTLADSDFICHKCHNRKCCNPNHLYKGDAASNSEDMKKSGRSKLNKAKPRGFESPFSKVPLTTVKFILQRYLDGETASSLARELKIGRTTISRIIHGEGMYAKI